jgi:hypothetical protein
MDQDLDMIEHQMQQTRASLAERTEALERQVVGMVHDTTAAIAGSVESAKEAVTETVSEVKGTVHEALEFARQALDLRLQVIRHPYAMLGGSLLLGFLTPRLLETIHSTQGRGAGEESSMHRHPSLGQRPADQETFAMADGPSNGPVRMSSAHDSGNWLGNTRSQFAEEIDRLKKLAIGAVFGAVRDYVSASAPGQVGTELGSIIDSFTIKLGGKPIQGPLFPNHEAAHSHL